MKKFLLCCCVYLCTFPVFAGGGRIVIENFNGTGLTGSSGLYIQARMYSPDHSRTIAGEKAVFQVQNQRTGERCITTNEVANEYGQIFGQCFSEAPGTMTVYVHSITSGDDSSVILLYFVAPTLQPTMKPITPIRRDTVVPVITTVRKDVVQPTIIMSTPSIPIPMIEVTKSEGDRAMETNPILKIIWKIFNFFGYTWHQ